ncbi:MAG: Nif3-like dinuclear metal center hexameric protein [Pseudomonadota bacterium]
MTASRSELVRFCDETLESQRFKDYCPNGLQVEGKEQVSRIAAAVTANQSVIDEAVRWGADALLVHHGYFWRGEEPAIVSMKKRRLASLLAAEVNLIAYHLPLDAHPELGNNAQLAARLGFTHEGPLLAEPGSVGNIGVVREPTSLEAIAQRWFEISGQDPLLIVPGEREKMRLAARDAQVLTEERLALEEKQEETRQEKQGEKLKGAIGDGRTRPITRVAWCTGAAQDYIEQAAQLGAELYISGEISERTVHSARELNIAYMAAGHHATERYGVQALASLLASTFDVEWTFIDCDNPV